MVFSLVLFCLSYILSHSHDVSMVFICISGRIFVNWKLFFLSLFQTSSGILVTSLIRIIILAFNLILYVFLTGLWWSASSLLLQPCADINYIHWIIKISMFLSRQTFFFFSLPPTQLIWRLWNSNQSLTFFLFNIFFYESMSDVTGPFSSEFHRCFRPFAAEELAAGLWNMSPVITAREEWGRRVHSFLISLQYMCNYSCIFKFT